MNLKTAFEQFLARPSLSPYTTAKYHYRLRRFVAQHADKRPCQITTQEIADHIYAQTHLKDASKAILRSCFHALFGYCQRQSWCDSNPAKALPHWRETPRRVRVPNNDDVKRALDTAVRLGKSGNVVNVRDGLIFTLAVMSGNRRGEIRNLELDELYDAMNYPEKAGDKTIYRVHTAGKTGECILRFTDFHVPHIRHYLSLRPEGADTAVFINLNLHHTHYGQKLSLTAFDRARLKICKRAGVPSITYQELRRRLATIIADKVSVDVAAQALNHSPHSGDRVIRLFYYDPDKRRVDDAAAQAFDVFGA